MEEEENDELGWLEVEFSMVGTTEEEEEEEVAIVVLTVVFWTGVLTPDVEELVEVGTLVEGGLLATLLFVD